MKKLSNYHFNHKWSIYWRKYKSAKRKDIKEKWQKRLFELLQINATIQQFNYDHSDEVLAQKKLINLKPRD